MALRNIAPILRRWWPLGAVAGGAFILGSIVRSIAHGRDLEATRAILASSFWRDVSDEQGLVPGTVIEVSRSPRAGYSPDALVKMREVSLRGLVGITEDNFLSSPVFLVFPVSPSQAETMVGQAVQSQGISGPVPTVRSYVALPRDL